MDKTSLGTIVPVGTRPACLLLPTLGHLSFRVGANDREDN